MARKPERKPAFLPEKNAEIVTLYRKTISVLIFFFKHLIMKITCTGTEGIARGAIPSEECPEGILLKREVLIGLFWKEVLLGVLLWKEVLRGLFLEEKC